MDGRSGWIMITSSLLKLYQCNSVITLDNSSQNSHLSPQTRFDVRIMLYAITPKLWQWELHCMLSVLLILYQEINEVFFSHLRNHKSRKHLKVPLFTTWRNYIWELSWCLLIKKRNDSLQWKAMNVVMFCIWFDQIRYRYWCL